MEALVHALLLEKEYVEFLVGRDGDFDQIVSSAVKRQQRLVRDDNSSLIWILPYPKEGHQAPRKGQAAASYQVEQFHRDQNPVFAGVLRRHSQLQDLF